MTLDDLIEQARDEKPAHFELNLAEWEQVSGRAHPALEVLLDGDSLGQGMIGRILGIPVYIAEVRKDLRRAK